MKIAIHIMFWIITFQLFLFLDMYDQKEVYRDKFEFVCKYPEKIVDVLQWY